MESDKKIKSLIQAAKIDQQIWSVYFLKRNRILRKAEEAAIIHAASSAQKIGIQAAAGIMQAAGSRMPSEIVKWMGCELTHSSIEWSSNYIVAGTFTEPSHITISLDTIELIEKEWNNFNLSSYIVKPNFYEVILAHELYHVVEYGNKQYSTFDIPLNAERRLFYKKVHLNNVLSEVAAFSFARDLMQMEVSPNFLDFLILNSRNPRAVDKKLDELKDLYQQYGKEK